jgi:hypothetical protein
MPEADVDTACTFFLTPFSLLPQFLVSSLTLTHLAVYQASSLNNGLADSSTAFR